MKKIKIPMDIETLKDLRAGDEVLLSGTVYTMRDMAHQKIFGLVKAGKKTPFDLNNQVIYYCGPTPAKPGNVIGSCGPTTSSRMDKYTPALLKRGIKGMIGKGERSLAVKDAIIENKAVYFSAVGGLGAEYAGSVVKSEVIAFPEMGPEAIYKLEIENFYTVVINDIHGDDLYIMNHIN